MNTQGIPRFAYFKGSFSKFPGGVPSIPPKTAQAPLRNLRLALNFQLFFLWGVGNTEKKKYLEKIYDDCKCIYKLRARRLQKFQISNNSTLSHSDDGKTICFNIII